ncbi:MAG: T9SS type A sorting domain-containing protein [Tannerellaceae bacterium]|jgi:hypothetical protein|nr:T9SS type A sorting domain-containing protein [Tannerellaceae bacterium]
MKRLSLLLICCGNLLHTASAQSIGQWHSCLAYRTTTAVAEGNTLVYALADGSLYSFGKEDNSLRYYAKETGLSDNLINCIAFHSGENTLVAAYANGNIDLITEDGSVYNIPFLLQSSSIQDKTVYSIYPHNGTAYLSGAFGIVALDVKRKEIKETYRLNRPVSSVAVHGDSIYALASSGLLRAALTDNLIDPANWSDYPAATSEGVNDTALRLCVFRDALCFLFKDKGIYYQAGGSMQPLLAHPSLHNIKVENGRLVAFSSDEVYIWSSFTERDKGSIAGITDVSSLKDPNTLWLATGEKGLTGIRRKAANQYEILADNIRHNAPARNLSAFLLMQRRKLYVAGGGRWTDRFGNPGTVMIYDTDSLRWNNPEGVAGFRDATCIAVDPNDPYHYFVSTWGEGVYEFKDGTLQTIYNHTNSALSTVYPNTPQQNHYIRTEGVCFDREGNLWMTNSEVSHALAVRKADGSWAKLHYPDISSPTLADKILITTGGLKWINLVRGAKSGVFVLDDKGTPEDTSDDISHYYSFLTDTQGKNIGAGEFYCITEDRKGAIWIGTNRGVFIVSAPARAAEGNLIGSRITHTDEYGNPLYFLSDERINAVAVDAGNRKWLGTESSGLYVVSEDGSEIIHHFTADHSPLLSNTVKSIAINHETGEVFAGTDKGLISYMGDATRGSENYSNVYAYPNPVRPDFDAQVIITGLMDNSNVKITDASGQLVYQGRSTGGQISWNFRNRNGSHVATGVYLVFCYTPEAGESCVTKIAVVRE